jgi:hypothetical protein
MVFKGIVIVTSTGLSCENWGRLTDREELAPFNHMRYKIGAKTVTKMPKIVNV